jgi:hypothetical protein
LSHSRQAPKNLPYTHCLECEMESTKRVEPMVGQPGWQRIILLSVLGVEGAGALSGGGLLVAEPDGRLMEMPVYIMHGVFGDFFVPGLILFALGILNTVALVAVFRKTRIDWLLAGLALGGLTIWFGVEIAVLHELHWLHVVWGLPVLAGDLAVLPLIPPRHATIPKALLVCGIVAFPLYLLATILGAMGFEGYDSGSQTVSELFAVGAPSKPLVDPLFIVYSILWIAFGAGVWFSSGGKRGLQIAAGGLIGKEVTGLVVQLLFPVHLRGVAGTSSDPVHGILTFVGVLCFLTAMWFGGTAFGKRFRLYSIGTLLVCVVFGALTGLEIPRMVANEPTPWMGVWERINIFAYLLWAVVLAVGLLRAPAQRPVDTFRG